ncbi:MAG: hypothetical protein LWX56_02425 [Ignavibacteria bacterium]|nr:hypothetical protein [Ignavibacteria bacterium]
MEEYEQWLNKIPENRNYLPTKDVILKWAAVRHKTADKAGAKAFPGLFSIHKFRTDHTLFWCAITIEALIAIFVLYKVSWNYMVMIILGVSIILDLACAYFGHSSQSDRCIADNKLYYEKDGSEKERLRDTITRAKIVHGIASFLIIAMFVGKVLGILWLFPGMSAGILPFLLSALYFLVAVVHITTTGFYFSGVSLIRSLKREFKKQNETAATYIKEPLPCQFNADVDLVPDTASDKKHILNKGAASEFILNCWGILFDSDITVLLDKQKPGSQQIYAEKLKEIQISRF